MRESDFHRTLTPTNVTKDGFNTDPMNPLMIKIIAAGVLLFSFGKTECAVESH
jgi:hypothetical protein